MSEEKKTVTTDERGPIHREVGDFGLVGDDFDPAATVNALTAEDRAALATALKLAAKSADVHGTEAAESRSTRSTQRKMQATTDTRIDTSRQSAKSNELDELLRRFEQCRRLDDLTLSCDYRKLDVIGQGGQGIVFKTECSGEYNLIKALKVFTPKPYDSMRSYYEDMDRLADVAKLVYHSQVDNLVTIERFNYQDGIFLMIMRLVNGYDLKSLLRPHVLDKVHAYVNQERKNHLNSVVVAKGPSQSRLTPGVAVYITVKCLRALEALHDQGVVHGDIKPANIMLDHHGSIRLVDLGSAFQLSSPPKDRTWTPMYAPPETFDGGEWTPQSDLASLGYVLIELLSGQSLVTAPETGSDSTRQTSTKSDAQLLEEKRLLPDRLNELMPLHVRKSHHLMGFLKRLIAPEPANRFASADNALVGPCGTFQFIQSLVRLDLTAPFSKEIRGWLADVRAAGA